MTVLPYKWPIRLEVAAHRNQKDNEDEEEEGEEGEDEDPLAVRTCFEAETVAVLTRSALRFYTRKGGRPLGVSVRPALCYDDARAAGEEASSSSSSRGGAALAAAGGFVDMVICVAHYSTSATTATQLDSDVGHLAILTEDGHILHSTVNHRQQTLRSVASSSSKTSANTTSMPTIGTSRIYKPDDACIGITELQLRNGIWPRTDDSATSKTTALLVTSLANGSIHVLELSESGIHRIETAHGDADKAQSAMHTLSCRGYRMDEDMDVDIDGHHALLAGVTPTGTCEIFRVTIGGSTEIGTSEGGNMNAMSKAGTRPFISVAIATGVSIRRDVGGASCCSVGDRFVAVGLSNGAVELYSCERILQHSCECAMTLSNAEWGYDADLTGGTTALSWSSSTPMRTPTPASTCCQLQRQVLAVGTRHGVVSVWSDTGCRLAFFPANGRATSDFDVAVSACCWCDNGMTLVVSVPGSAGESKRTMQPTDTPSGRDDALYCSCVIEISFAVGTETLSYVSMSAADVPITPTCVSHALTIDGAFRANRMTAASTHVLLGCDRLILVGDTVCPSRRDASAVRHVHVCAPASYVESNAPLVVASVSPGGGHVAVAGQKGFVVYNIRAGTWTMFGDVVQEKSIVVSSLAWMGDSIICAAVQSSPKAAGADTAGGFLYFYPRSHLNEARVLHRERLPSMPVAMKAYGQYLVVSLDARLQRFAVYRIKYVVGSASTASVALMRVDKGVGAGAHFHVDLVHHVDRPHIPPLTSAGIVDIALMCCSSDVQRHQGVEQRDRNDSKSTSNVASSAFPSSRSESKFWLFGWGERDDHAEATSTVNHDAWRMPGYLLALTTRGDLVAHDLTSSTDSVIATGVHSAFIPRPGGDEEKRDTCDVSEPIWTYSRAGVCATFVHSRDASYASSTRFLMEFDNEVQPLGMNAPHHRLVGVTASASLQHSASSFLPCFTCSLRTQSLVPNLVLLLLDRLDEERAYRLASKAQDAHEFPMWMELALYGALEHDDNYRDDGAGSTKSIITSTSSASVVEDDGKTSHNSTMVQRVVALLQRLYPASLYVSVVVGVARKTDPRLWSRLFDAAGQPSDLFERCLRHGSTADIEFALDAAANLVRVIERFDGSSVAQEKALLVLDRLLDVEQYQRCTEIILFLVRCGHDASYLRLDVQTQQQLMLARATPAVASAPSGGISSAFTSLWSFMGASAEDGGKDTKEASLGSLGAVIHAHVARLLLSLRLRRLHRMATACDVCLASILREDAIRRDMAQTLLNVRATLAAEPALRDELQYGLVQSAFIDDEDWRDVLEKSLAQMDGENGAADITTLSLESDESGDDNTDSAGDDSDSDSHDDANAIPLHAHNVELSIAQSLTQSLV